MNIFKSKLVITVTAAAVLVFGGLYWVKNRQISATIDPCVNNLMIIQMCKLNWAITNEKQGNDVPTWDDLKPELESYAEQYGWKNWMPTCPDGGTYTIGRVDEPPTCSIGGPRHSLPQ